MFQVDVVLVPISLLAHCYSEASHLITNPSQTKLLIQQQMNRFVPNSYPETPLISLNQILNTTTRHVILVTIHGRTNWL